MNGVFTSVRMKIGYLWVAVALALAAPAGAAGQTTGSRVLVMPFAVEVEPGAPGGAGAALWLGEAAALLVSEGLSTRGVGAMTRDETVAAFARVGLPLTSALTRATMIRVGELIGASEVVFGSVGLGSNLTVRARLVNLTSGGDGPVIEDAGALADIFAVIDRVSGQLSTRTGRLRPARAAPTPLALGTFENYVKGLVAATPTAQQRFLESAVREAPTDPRILMALWNVYTAQGVHERALASANAVEPDAAVYREARFAVALSLIELRRFDGAWQVLTTLHNGERSAAVSNALGVVQLRRGVAASGGTPASYFARAVEEDPENTDYLFNLGYAHARGGNAAEALVWLRETVRFDVADGDAHYVMSAVLASNGRGAEAQRELDLARMLGGTVQDSSVLLLTTEVPLELERVSMVPTLSNTSGTRMAIANPAQRDQQEAARFHLANGEALIAAGRDRDATGELRRAVYLAPYEQVPHLLLGQIYRRAGRLSEAVDQIRVSLWCRETVAARVELGAVLLETGEATAARREVERALELEPGSVEAQALLARIGG